MRGMWVALLAPVLGCVGKDTEEEETCVVAEVAPVSPLAGATEVAVDAVIEVEVSPPEARVFLSIDGGVTDGAVELAGAGALRALQPDAPLQPSTTYTVGASSCGDAVGQWSFETQAAAVGPEVEGLVWHLSFTDPDMVWTEPPTALPLSVLVGGLDTTRGLLVGFTSVEGSRGELVAGLSEEVEGVLGQHRCIAPGTLSGVDLSANPRFSAGPTDLVITDGDAPISLLGMGLDGVVRDGGAWVQDLRLHGRFDLRQIESAEDLDLCGLIVDVYGGDCSPCPDQGPDDEPWCAALDITVPRATRVDMPALSAVIEPDPTCDE
jgi:hypothetical protein